MFHAEENIKKKCYVNTYNYIVKGAYNFANSF